MAWKHQLWGGIGLLLGSTAAMAQTPMPSANPPLVAQPATQIPPTAGAATK